jgi:hypothetical protein
LASAAHQDAAESVGVDGKVGPHRRGAVGDEAAGRRVRRKIALQLGDFGRPAARRRRLVLERDMDGHQHLARHLGEPGGRRRADRRIGERVGERAVPEEAVGTELGVPLPAQAEATEIGDEMRGGGRRRRLTVDLAQACHIGTVAVGVDLAEHRDVRCLSAPASSETGGRGPHR